MKSVSFCGKNQSLTVLGKTSSSRICGRFRIGMFIRKDSYREDSDDTMEKGRMIQRNKKRKRHETSKIK